MPVWKRKVQRALNDELRPGEDVLAAIFLQPMDRSAPAPSPESNGVYGLAVANGRAGHETMVQVRDGAGLAAILPNAPTVLAVTTQRVLAMGHSSLTGRPKEIVSTLAPNDLVGVEVDGGCAGSLVIIRFSDGTGRMYETPQVTDGVLEFAKRINDH